MRSVTKLWILSIALGVTLVAVAFWNVVIHENGWNLTFVIWPGLLVGFFTGVNYHDGFNRAESVITFVASVAFWIPCFFIGLFLARAPFRKKEPNQPPEPMPQKGHGSS